MPAIPTALVDSLRRQINHYRTLVLDRWDQLEADAQSLLNRIGYIHDNRVARENPVRFEEIFYKFTAHRWVDEISTAGAFSALEWTVPIDGYDSFVPYNAVNIGRPGHQERLDQIMAKAPQSHERIQVRALMSVFRANPLAVTGVNFFHAAHPRPSVYGGTFNNIMAPAWVAAGSPKEAEVQALIDSVKARFSEITTVESEVVDDEQFGADILFIVHNSAHYEAFSRVKRKEKISSEENLHRDSFGLLRDVKPTFGQENYIEVVFSEPGGARPSILVLDQDPEPDMWDDDRVRNGYVALGVTSMFGVAPGAPWTALQIRPTTI